MEVLLPPLCSTSDGVILSCRVQLTTCIHHIIKHDYPNRWTAVVEKIGFYLQSDNSALLGLGILLCLYQLYTLPLELINQPNLTEWIEILKTVVDRDVPAVSIPGSGARDVSLHGVQLSSILVLSLVQETLQVEEDDGLSCLGGSVRESRERVKEYNEFAEVFLKAFAAGVQQVRVVSAF
ncbi:unnamed protein product [Ranitomeya imitator]|uniref:Uncharacterized protein n=1 Tax=Ranitomeya imitator TaxID=111125 RepID=A0ABN9LYB0_9NEOB|nr:unnamed protein product [Ranitomeya imitator]